MFKYTILCAALFAVLASAGFSADAGAKPKAYLEITLNIPEANRPAAVKVYTDYRQPFLDQINGAMTKELLVRGEDVQVLHGFDSVENAKAYLSTEMFQKDVVAGLKPLWQSDPDVRIYSVF